LQLIAIVKSFTLLLGDICHVKQGDECHMVTRKGFGEFAGVMALQASCVTRKHVRGTFVDPISSEWNSEAETKNALKARSRLSPTPTSVRFSVLFIAAWEFIPWRFADRQQKPCVSPENMTPDA
jgi:hypothetical protein